MSDLRELLAVVKAAREIVPHMEHGVHLAYKKWLADSTSEDWGKMQTAMTKFREALQRLGQPEDSHDKQ